MKPSAFIINMARGPVIDEAALLNALTSGQIAGAGLDVFAKEPLPADSPLWDAPNMIITPHATPEPAGQDAAIDRHDRGQYRALPRGTAHAQRDHQKGRLHAAGGTRADALTATSRQRRREARPLLAMHEATGRND